MKKILMIVALLSMISGCATTSTQSHSQLTAENIQSACKPTETWQIRVMPMPVAVIRFANGCGGVKDLLMFATPKEDFTKRQRDLSVELALSYYLNYLERSHAVEGKKWSATQIKLEVDESREYYYYKVLSQPPSAKR